MSTYSIIRGDVLEVLREYRDNSFDALLSDPPYGLSFMGKEWDHGVPNKEVWAECLRVLKPGAPLLAFGGTRTFHRLTCAIEDAGFEIRDCLTWLYAKGFPKSQNIALAIDKAAGAERQVVGSRILTGNAAVSLKDKGGTYGVQVGSVGSVEIAVTEPATELAKLWDGWGSALKPSWEPIILARKSLEGTMAENIAKWGIGGLAIDDCRIGMDAMSRSSRGMPKLIENVSMTGANYERQNVGVAEGRWPANLIFSHSEHCIQVGSSSGPGFSRNRQTDGAHPFGGAAGSEFTSEPVPEMLEHWACVPECPIRCLDDEAGPRKSGKAVRRNGGGGQIMSGIRGALYKPKPPMPDAGYLDGKTNPSRFFFSSKVSTKERDAGCEGLPNKSAGEIHNREEDSAGINNPSAGTRRTGGAHNHHPTLKPIALATWLATLIKPPSPGAILVPFSGSGSEMIGCLKAGWGAVLGIDKDLNDDGQPAGYVDIARARLRHWCPESEEG